MSEITQVTTLLVGRLIDIGSHRTEQQDNLRVVNMFEHEETFSLAKRKGNLYVLADGVGGEAGGAIASQVAVETVIAEYYADTSYNVEASLATAIQNANQRIVEEGQKRQLPQMRTTIVCAVVRGNELVVAHVGDSRCYFIRKGQVSQLTQDHSMARYWRESGLLSEEQISKRIDRKNLARSLGNPDGVKPEVRREEIEINDTFMLCSDGLYELVNEAQLGGVITSHPNPQSGCETLVKLANEAGAPDNISVIVGHIREVVEEVDHEPVQNDLDVPKIIMNYVHTLPPLSQSKQATQTINRERRLRKWLTWACSLLGIVVLVALFINLNLLRELGESRDRLDNVVNEVNRLSTEYQKGEYGAVDETLLQKLRAIEESVTSTPLATPATDIPIIIPTRTNQPTLSPKIIITPTHTAQPSREEGQ